MTVTVTSPPVVVISPTGIQGPRGSTILAGSGAPGPTVGIDGDWYIDNATPATLVIYGPKTAGAWGTGQPIGGSGGGGGAPTGPAGGDLSGSYPNPGVAKVNGVTVTGTPTTGQVPTAASGTAASWQTPAIPRLDQVGAPTGDVAMASHKLTGLANGGTATDAAAFGQIPVAGTTAGTYAAGNDGRLSDSRAPSGTASGDLSGTYPGPTVARVNGVAVTGTPTVGQVPTATSGSAATWQTPAGGGGGASVRTATARITDDNLSGLPSAPTWAVVLTSAATPLQCTIPAVVGDRIEVTANFMYNGSQFLDWVLLDNTGAISVYAASGTSSPLAEGNPGYYPSFSFSRTNAAMFTVGAGHILGGAVTIGLAHQGTGAGLVYAHAVYPWQQWLTNLGNQPA